MKQQSASKEVSGLTRQPQEEEKKSLTENMIEQKKTSDQNIVVVSEKIQVELIENAECKLAGFVGLKSGIDTKLKKVLLMLLEIRQIIQNNINSEQVDDGFLTEAEAKYLVYLELKHAQLEALFQKDKTHWEQKVTTVKKKA